MSAPPAPPGGPAAARGGVAEVGTGELKGLGQGAFTTRDDGAVVRKDYKVLLVDTSRLPAQFGSPPQTRSEVATNVAAAIMGCWTGA